VSITHKNGFKFNFVGFAHDWLGTTRRSNSQSTNSEGPLNIYAFGPVFCNTPLI